MVVKRDYDSVESLTRHLRRVFNHTPVPTILPYGVRLKHLSIGGLKGERVSVRDAENTVLYIHGGGFVAGVTRTYHNLAGQLASQLNASVYLPSYRLAPEHPYPAGLEDIVSAYQWLLDKGTNPSRLVVAGDSAGGGITLALLMKLRDMGLPLPKAAVTLSPAADARGVAESIEGNHATDALLSASLIHYAAEALLPGMDRMHPYASPALADFTGMPPLFITVDEEECLRDDAHLVARRAREAGCEVKLISRKGMFHVWPIFTPFLPEARRDIRRIVKFLQEQGLTVSNRPRIIEPKLVPFMANSQG
ncbi:alpha/beta hydrolase fold domain protein [Oleiphilus messinensis]|uniref:Alpha/beta hydrolase fold domain protein n=2 Tax=Oleiphilus messinensis TaxID=141451 RepID=A0A1Y0I8K6_9GAMM|nr:alpha/beta hydrolase fold domain protein [Oleiphilus messinensis]